MRTPVGFRFFYFAVAILFGMAAAPQSASAAFVLANSNGGDGYVTPTANGFILTGSDNGSGLSNYTTYTDVATEDSLFTYSYTYTSYDDGLGADIAWDPAGYIIGDVYTQLTPDYDIHYGNSVSGIIQLAVLAGQTYGFYIFSVDSCCGPSELSVASIPLPAALPLFASALIGLGVISRRKRA